MEFSDESLSSLRIARVFHGAKRAITSIDVSPSSRYFAAASEDESLSLFDAHEGRIRGSWFSRKYGVDLPRFMSHEDRVVIASRNEADHTMRFWNLGNNKFLRYFRGHRDVVTSIAGVRNSDRFWSASKDKYVKMWDTRHSPHQARISLPCRGCVGVAHDSMTGIVLAIATPLEQKGCVWLYDSRNIGAPFKSIEVGGAGFGVHGINFSPSGKLLALSTRDCVFLLDVQATAGNEVMHIFPYSKAESDFTSEVSFSPDSQYITCGLEDGSISLWNCDNGIQVVKLKGHHGPVRAVKWSRDMALLTTACSHTAFWIPNESV